MVELVTLLVVHLLKCFFAGSQLEQIVNSSSSCIYITACFRAGASVQDNTLYLAALLLLPYSLQSVGTWDGGGSGSTYQLRASCCSPPARLPGSWPHCCPLCLPLLSAYVWRHTQVGREGSASAIWKGCLCSLCEKVWAVAKGRQLGCHCYPVWIFILCLALYFPGRFPMHHASISVKN